MNRNPILTGVPEVPADQITIPLPPISAAERSEGLLRLPHAQSDTKSYRNQVIRIWPDGPEAKAVDLVTTADPTVGPDALFGPGCGRSTWSPAPTASAGSPTATMICGRCAGCAANCHLTVGSGDYPHPTGGRGDRSP